MIAFGDSSGVISLWADKEGATVNPYSRPSEQPDVAAPPPAVKIYDDRPAPRIPPEVMANVKMIDFVGYAPNPGTFHRNQNMALSAKARKEQREGPKFRSEQEREKYFGQQKRPGKAKLQSEVLIDSSGQPNPIPKHYRKVEIKYSKFGVEDFDFGFYNGTLYGGLETHIANSYCNAMLQVLFFNRPLREIAKSHIKTKCPKEFCLCCELGFLFRMLEDARGANCQATNFLRAFGTIPQASALGLFEPEAPTTRVSYSSLIQNFNRFILEQIHQEYGPNPGGMLIQREYGETVPSLVQQVFGSFSQTVSTCGVCHTEIVRDTAPFVVDMAYARKKLGAKGHAATDIPQRFVEILQHSINRETFTRAWCAQCSRYQPTTQSKYLRCAPNVLSINANATNEEDLEMYFSDGEDNLQDNRYQDMYNTLTIGFVTSVEQSEETWIPKRIAIIIEGTKLRVIELAAGAPDVPEPGENAEIAIYALTASIVEIQEKEQSHLVAHVSGELSDVNGCFAVFSCCSSLETSSVAHQGRAASWYVFNDFLVETIPALEARQFSKWKRDGSFLPYHYGVIEVSPDSLFASQGSKLNLFCSRRKERDLKINYKRLRPEELPNGPGLLCAIDAEFVALNKVKFFVIQIIERPSIDGCAMKQEETEIRSDGTKSVLRPSRFSLARVSVLRGEGPDEGVPFIDEYVSTTEQVVDYLTEFSGIKAGDLDPNQSRHPLVSLKSAYKKLRLLVDMGCIFVGHGLKKDFRTINILVPPEQVIDTVDLFFVKTRQRQVELLEIKLAVP
ncbi:poly(A)-specific ribonuclease [Borealophlyctis nickersoniae]|nr:poly(A)-specific ribonuclease [Borealophlyctis nickersoniae]